MLIYGKNVTNEYLKTGKKINKTYLLDNYEENLGIYKQREEIIKIKDSTKDDNTRILLEKLL